MCFLKHREVSVCFQQLSSELGAGVRLQPSLARPGCKADDLLITQLRFRHCRWRWVNTPPLPRNNAFHRCNYVRCPWPFVYLTWPLLFPFVCQVIGQESTKCPWRKRPRKPQADWEPRRVVWHAHGSRVAQLGWRCPCKECQRDLPMADQVTSVAVHGCWASSSRAGGCDMLVAKVVACSWYFKSVFLCSTPVGSRGT